MREIEEETHNEALLLEKTANFIDSLPSEGPDPEVSTFLLKTAFHDNRRLIFDNFVNREEIFSQTDLIRDFEKFTQNSPEYLLPAPDFLPIQEDEFVLGFPFFQEAPVFYFNPDSQQLLENFFQRLDKAEPRQTKIVFELISSRPETLR